MKWVDQLDWWFKMAMCIMLPTIVILGVGAFLPWRKRTEKWEGRDVK